MTQRLRVLAALAEDLGMIPSIHKGSQLSMTPVLEDTMPSSGLYRNCMHRCTYTHTGKTLIK